MILQMPVRMKLLAPLPHILPILWDALFIALQRKKKRQWKSQKATVVRQDLDIAHHPVEV
jgi:hypothetical protein